jgi:hypothetical protein
MVGLTNHVNFFADFGLGGFGRKVAHAGNMNCVKKQVF